MSCSSPRQRLELRAVAHPSPLSWRRIFCEEQDLTYLSDVNLRAVLVVLVTRAGGSVEVTNEELYDAMLPGGGHRERFLLAETDRGVQVSIQASQQEQAESS
jgi:hypothetical protein